MRRSLSIAMFAVCVALSGGSARADGPAAPAKPAPQIEVPPSLEPAKPVQMPDEPGDDPTRPGRSALRWDNQFGEGRLEGAALFSTPTHGGLGKKTTGWEATYATGSIPQLTWFRIGGSYGFHAKMWDDKSFAVSPFYELAGGFRLGPAELFAFSGLSFVTVGVSHTKIALGLVSPRAGVAAGFRIFNGIALDVFAASELNWGVLGFDDFRTQMIGGRITLLSPPAPHFVQQQQPTQ